MHVNINSCNSDLFVLNRPTKQKKNATTNSKDISLLTDSMLFTGDFRERIMQQLPPLSSLLPPPQIRKQLNHHLYLLYSGYHENAMKGILGLLFHVKQG